MKYNEVIEPPQIVTDVAGINDEPVTLTEVKQHLNLQFDTSGSYQFDDDDTKLQDIMKQSRALLEEYTGVSMAAKTYRAILRNECGNIDIPMGPITAITSVKDIEGTALVDGTTYNIRGNQFKWIEAPRACYIEINYTSGYTPANIPLGLKRALLEQIAWNYSNAGDQEQRAKGGTIALCEPAMNSAAPYKRKSIIA